MWETIGNVLTSGNAGLVGFLIIIILVLVIWAGKKGLFNIHTDTVTIGGNDRELTIVRNQSQWAYLFIMSIKGKILPEDASKQQNDRTELILEKVYDKIVEWITYNHITDNSAYVEIKQSEVCSVVYNFDDLSDEYKTPEFKTRMENWTKEVILNLIKIRKVYSNQK